MTILQEIQKWSLTLPEWQQHAVAVLYKRPNLEAADIEHIYALLKQSKGIPDPEQREASKLTEEQVASPEQDAPVVKLQSIKNLQGVNALATGKTLSLAADGLSIIYGDNGAGKSGYSRLLKQACRARDQDEKIRANIFLENHSSITASAKFDILVDGTTAEVGWENGSIPPPELASIAIFDSRCARAYLDNEGDFAYVPYGLDILSGLGRLCEQLKVKTEHERALTVPNLNAFAKLSQSDTETGKIVRSLSATTCKEEIERLATLDQEDLDRLAALKQTLSETDPKRKASEIRAKASRIESLEARVSSKYEALSNEKIQGLRILIEKSNRAKEVAAIAANQFKNLGLLEGTGNEAWIELFKAAKLFCQDSMELAKFPTLKPTDHCPLCQNELEVEGVTRLLSFEAFIEGEASNAAKVAHATAKNEYLAMVDQVVELAVDQSLVDDLQGHPDLLSICSEIQNNLQKRQEKVRLACTLKNDAIWAEIPALYGSPAKKFSELVESLRLSAKNLEDSVDQAAKAKMNREWTELQARQQLSDLKHAALSAIDSLQSAAQLAECTKATNTTGISKKSTELTNTMATKEVADVLSEELLSLGVHEIKVKMKPSSAKARTTFKLVLETESGAAISEVLSEGEQRAIAIASFLCEVRLGSGLGGIVFDDPVSSLDHGRRERVAARLVKEALTRQVVVFTHDIFFLNSLRTEAAARNLETHTQTLKRTPEGFGVAIDSLPFVASNVSERIGKLRNKQVYCASLHKQGDEDGYMLYARDLYNDLRMSWERGIEELLFNQVVIRFRKGIETGRLNRVVVDELDKSTIAKGMGKCSNYTGHDGSMHANISMPDPHEMASDIDELDNWRALVSKRLNSKK